MKYLSKLYGVYSLPINIECDSAIMGKSFEVVIGKTKGNIIFPSLSSKFLEYKEKGHLEKDLKIPGPVCPINTNWFNKEDGFGVTGWGQTLTFPAGESTIKKVLLTFEFEDNGMELNTNDIYDNITEWFNNFYDIKELVTGISTYKKEAKNPIFVQGFGLCSTNLQLYLYDDNKKEYFNVLNEADANLAYQIQLCGNFLKIEELQKIINYLNKSKGIKFDYKYYLEGKRAFENEDFIKAVTICSPALEFVLSQSLEAFCKSKGIYFLNKLRKKYRMLGGMFDLAEDIKMPLPTSDYRTKILKLRNKVIHEGYRPSKKEVNDYLKDIKLYIDTLSPSLLEN